MRKVLVLSAENDYLQMLAVDPTINPQKKTIIIQNALKAFTLSPEVQNFIGKQYPQMIGKLNNENLLEVL